MMDEENLNEPGLFSLKRKLRRGLIAVYSCLMRGCRENRCMGKGWEWRMRGEGHKLKHGNFWLITKEKKVTVRVVKHWKQGTTVAAKSLVLRCSKLDSTRPWGTSFNWPYLEQGLEMMTSQVPSNLHDPMILWRSVPWREWMKGVRVIYLQPTYIKSISMSLNDPEIFWDVIKKPPKPTHLLRPYVFKAFEKLFFFSLTFTIAILWELTFGKILPYISNLALPSTHHVLLKYH